MPSALAVAVSVCASSIAPPPPATATWNGLGASDNFSDAMNWVGGQAPGAGSHLIFAGVTRLTPNNNAPIDTEFASITFTNTAGAFTIGGNRIKLAGNITNNGASAQTLNIAINLTANITILPATGLAITMVLNGAITETGGARSITLPYSDCFVRFGTDSVPVTNTFSGGLILDEGWAVGSVGNNTAFGAGAITMQNASSGIYVYGQTIANNITIGTGTDGHIYMPAASVATVTGTIALADSSARLRLYVGAVATHTLSGVISGAGKIAVDQDSAGGGVILTATNTYTGSTTVNSGKLIAGSTQSFGVNSAVAAYTGGTLDITGFNTSIGSLTGSAASVILGSATLTIGGDNTSPATSSAVISGTGKIVKVGPGTLTLSGASTYTGTTSIQNGAISVNSIKNLSGGASALGNPTTAGNGTIAIGLTTVSGSLIYTGTGDTTNRVIDLAGTSGNAQLEMAGTGTLTLTSNLTVTGNAAKTLVLTGSTAGIGQINGVIPNAAGFTIDINKTGSGKWIVNGVNTQTGITTIDAGTLQVGDGTNTTARIIGTKRLNGGTLLYNFSADKFDPDGKVTLSANSTIGNIGNFQLNYDAGGTFTGAGFTLTINNGSSTKPFYFNQTAGSALGQLNITAGTVAQAGFGGKPLTGAAIAVSSGAAYRSYGTATIANAITLNGGTGPDGNGAIFNEGGGAATFSGLLTLASATDSTISTSASSITFTGGIAGAGSFTKAGSNIVTISTTATTFTGTATVAAGQLSILVSMGSASGITVSGGRLRGTSTVSPAPTTVANVAGSDVQAGTTATGTLTTGNITFSGVNAAINTRTDGTTTVSLIAAQTVVLGGMTANFEPAHNLNAGTYTMMTSTGMSGTVVQGTTPIGRTWVSLGIVGNNLVAVLS